MADLRPYPAFDTIIRNFAPGWFASVMGTGSLALTSLYLSAAWPWLATPANILNYGNFILFGVLLVPWILRWIRYPADALATLKNPAQAAFYPTFAVAMLVLAAQAVFFAMGTAFALVIWWSAIVVAFLFNFIILFNIFSSETTPMEDIAPAHFIPAVGLVVIPIAGIPLLEHLSGVPNSLAYDLALAVNAAGIGAGSLLYIGLFSLLFHRHYMNRPLAGRLTPTVWIHLAPLGWIPVDLAALINHLGMHSALEFAGIFALIVWAAGLWWVIMAALLTVSAIRKRELAFGLPWWGFVFPVGAMVTLSFRVHTLLDFTLAHTVGVILWVFMGMVWLLILWMTARKIISGDIFR